MAARWLLPLLVLAACTPAPQPVIPTEASPSASIAPTPSVEPEMVAGLALRPPTASQRAFLEKLYLQNWHGWTCGAVSRVFSGGGWGPVSVYSGNYDFNYGFGVFPEGDTHLAAQALTTAEAAGGTGEAVVLFEAIVKPIVAAWADDAELARDYVGMPRFTDGTPRPEWVRDEAAILAKFGWPIAYRSKARREILNFHVDAERTLVVRSTYDGPVPTEAQVPIDRQSAIEKAKAVLRDPSARSLEERTGRDYVSGLPYRPHQPGDPVGASNTTGLEPVYELPDSLAWRADFYGFFAGKPIWQVYGQQTTHPSPIASIPVGSTFTVVDYSSETWIDAQTGEAIRFRRPHRSTATIVAPPVPLLP